MLNNNPILDSNNEAITISNLFGRLAINTLDGLPLGAVADSVLGELFLKVGIVNGLVLGGSQLTPVSTLVNSGSGATITAGKRHVEFILSSDFAGNINGIAYSGTTDAVQSFDAPPGYTLAAIAYTRSAGSLRIISF